MYNTDHIKMHQLWLSSRQDKTSIKLLAEQKQVLPIIRQENNKILFPPSLFWIKTISIEMQSYHTVKKNSTSEYEHTEQRK